MENKLPVIEEPINPANLKFICRKCKSPIDVDVEFTRQRGDDVEIYISDAMDAECGCVARTDEEIEALEDHLEAERDRLKGLVGKLKSLLEGFS